MCTQSNLPSVSSINRIIRNRAADRTAMAYARMLNSSFCHIPPPVPPLWSTMLHFPDPPPIHRPPQQSPNHTGVFRSSPESKFPPDEEDMAAAAASNGTAVNGQIRRAVFFCFTSSFFHVSIFGPKLIGLIN